MTSPHPFRFGVNMLVPTDRSGWVEKCRKAEEFGYDVVGVADHLGMPAPFPALVLAAEATERVRLNTFVLNAAFYNPALLAREVAGTDQFTEGRLELGLGAGYVQQEFETAGIPFERPGRRIDHLARTVTELERLFADPEYQPRPAQPSGPPLLLAGRGDRLLTLAARHAKIIGFTGAAAGDGRFPRLDTAEGVDERVAFARKQLGDRADDVELNILVQRVAVTTDRRRTLEKLAEEAPDLTAEQLGEVPTILAGTPAQLAEQLRERRERFGFSYVTVLEDNLEKFAPVIELLR
ncbi:probable F420-dependent oxidoreductase, MSMEG_2516 family [Amycolatopsis marina]|uniref:Probable F420-dependent oxidoreductase, MSMEG_2516 family n=1 Tax=Amycolatopsis marina TaxID=490629 RepID=A0A1I0VUS6_9PSEU|nr:LLM class F420-dependent oxidoreductase [Amycolatopsis marina]SFA79660.1 probable F420-dependent oxidoreductase, MSMEG_2516 family [Amycolatopsis marina]